MKFLEEKLKKQYGTKITKEIIELHGGNISVKNDDEFIEFYIELENSKEE